MDGDLDVLAAGDTIEGVSAVFMTVASLKDCNLSLSRRARALGQWGQLLYVSGGSCLRQPQEVMAGVPLYVRLGR